MTIIDTKKDDKLLEMWGTHFAALDEAIGKKIEHVGRMQQYLVLTQVAARFAATVGTLENAAADALDLLDAVVAEAQRRNKEDES